MNTETLNPQSVRLMDDCACGPVDLPGSALAALLLPAGKSTLRRRAGAAHSLAAHSGPSSHFSIEALSP